MMTKAAREKKIEAIINDLKSSSKLPDKLERKPFNKTKFVKLAKEVKKIFEEEERERRLSTSA